ncbi:MAG TPA: hypothetical protein VKT77_09805 [Chthonomonadaceae bacterium]|nr:hypothetical protein [Chthonomonadaceae bacterium]
MAEQAESRKMRLLEHLAAAEGGEDLDDLAAAMRCDARTVRRDLESLQELLRRVQGIELQRGRVVVSRPGFSPGYFTDQLDRHAEAKERIARAIVARLEDGTAVALTAGSTPFAVAREIRRAGMEGDGPRNLIVFTNSVPALLELVSAGVSTGALGEIYAAEDCAFHSPELRSAFQPEVAIVGASGVLFGPAGAQQTLELFSHRAEEAAFLKQLLAGVPEIVVAADSSKLGRRHPWSFGGDSLAGKRVRIVTEALTDEQRADLSALSAHLAEAGTVLEYEAAPGD